MRAATLLLIGACAGARPPPPLRIQARSTAPPAADAGRWVRWLGYGFETPRLPALQGDGGLVVFARPGDDTLTIVVADRLDAVRRELVVVAPGESKVMFAGDHVATELLRQRLDDANRALDELASKSRLVPLAKLSVPRWMPGRGDADELPPEARRRAYDDEVTLDWLGDHVSVEVDHTMVNARVASAGWFVHVGRCPHPPWFGGAWANAAHAIALVEIDYVGSERCPAPSPRYHVITW